jgi:hypothetical protein
VPKPTSLFEFRNRISFASERRAPWSPWGVAHKQPKVVCRRLANVCLFFQKGAHLQTKTLGENNASNFFWNASISQSREFMSWWQKIIRIVVRNKLESTGHQEKQELIRKKTGTKNTQGRNRAKTKIYQIFKSRDMDGQLVGLEHSHGSSLDMLEPLDKHFYSYEQILPGFQPTIFLWIVL